MLVSLLTLASFLKVQKYAFFESAKGALAGAREVPVLMRVAMLLLAASCVLTAFLAAAGFETPYLAEAAAKALAAGRFAM